MDQFLDALWLKIVALTQMAVQVMDVLVAPLNALGPGVAIFILVFITVCVTKLFRRFYTTKRYEALKKEFSHWAEIRKEAMSIEDREKGKALAKNIDKAKLNKVYYDYFFEGLLNNILTTVLPILLMAAYVNDAYRAEKLLQLFGRASVFTIYGFGGNPIPVGALAWFVLSLLLIHLIWAVTIGRYLKKNKKES